MRHSPVDAGGACAHPQCVVRDVAIRLVRLEHVLPGSSGRTVHAVALLLGQALVIAERMAHAEFLVGREAAAECGVSTKNALGVLARGAGLGAKHLASVEIPTTSSQAQELETLSRRLGVVARRAPPARRRELAWGNFSCCDLPVG